MIHRTPTREQFDAIGDFVEKAPDWKGISTWGHVSLPLSRYDDLLEKEKLLRCLEAVGIPDEVMDRALMLLAQAEEKD